MLCRSGSLCLALGPAPLVSSTCFAFAGCQRRARQRAAATGLNRLRATRRRAFLPVALPLAALAAVRSCSDCHSGCSLPSVLVAHPNHAFCVRFAILCRPRHARAVEHSHTPCSARTSASHRLVWVDVARREGAFRGIDGVRQPSCLPLLGARVPLRLHSVQLGWRLRSLREANARADAHAPLTARAAPRSPPSASAPATRNGGAARAPGVSGGAGKGTLGEDAPLGIWRTSRAAQWLAQPHLHPRPRPPCRRCPPIALRGAAVRELVCQCARRHRVNTPSLPCVRGTSVSGSPSDSLPLPLAASTQVSTRRTSKQRSLGANLPAACSRPPRCRCWSCQSRRRGAA
jgi:hypothetical protein